MSLAPTNEVIKRETSGKPLVKEKNLLGSWAPDKSVRMVYYHLSSVIFVRVWSYSFSKVFG